MVSIVAGEMPGPGTAHGLSKIVSALEAKNVAVEQVASLDAAKGGTLIVVGAAQESPAADLLTAAGGSPPDVPEALAIRHTQCNGKPALVVCGSDDRGLMYAELDMADRIGWAADPGKPLSEVKDAAEKPAVPERALSKLVINRSEFESYCFSEEYWTQYLDMMAANRYNTFVLMLGYSSAGYFDPPYPFLFDIEEFPDVRVVEITKEQQQRNVEMFNTIVRMTHDRGMDFTLALWTHIYRGVKEPTPGLAWGLTDDNLVAYTKAAFAKFLQLVPGFDGIQFRLHVESSVKLPQQIPFWDAVLGVIKESGQNIRADMRVKGSTDDMIEAAFEHGLNMRLTTKYWGEQMGLPYHPTHITGRNQFKRRHTYADLLHNPPSYKMHYRLWNHGTTRILQWADPEYVRRFAGTVDLSNGDGFEVHEMMAFKMAHRRDETYDLLKPQHQYYRWEFERFWHFFQVFGRVGYNPDTPPEVWRVEFEKRFGKDAAPYIEQALHSASRIVPRIIAYNLTDLSADCAWPEKQRWNELPVYARSEPSDTAQFMCIEEAARHYLQGKDSARRWPQHTSRWFEAVSKEVFDLVAKAEENIGSNANKEFASTIIDLKVLANISRYHSQRIHAGLQYAFFDCAHDLNALREAIRHERDAIATWEEIVKLTDGVYHDDIVMGGAPRLTGSWKTELVELKKGLEQLEEMEKNFQPQQPEIVAKFDFGEGPPADGYVRVAADTRYDRTKGGCGWWHVHPSPSPPAKTGPVDNETDRDFLCGPKPMAYTDSSFTADMPNGRYELEFSMLDSSEQPQDYGPIWIVGNGMDFTERFVLPAGERVTTTLRTTVTDGRLNVVLNAASSGQWIVNSMIVRRIDAVVAHVPIRKAAPRGELPVCATVSGPAAIEAVRLVYGSEERGWACATMEKNGKHTYRAAIPAEAVVDGLAYFIEANDEDGGSASYPPDGGLQPLRVTVAEDNQPPTVSHTPVTSCHAGKPLVIDAQVADDSGVKWVRLRYRGLSQHQDFRTLSMLPTGKGNVYRAEIPASHIRPEWDMMYFIEVMDVDGNGAIHPDLETETPYVVVDVQR